MDKKDDKALVVRPMIARDLDKAGKGQLVYVGRDGEVKDPSGVRKRQLAAYIAFGGITAAGVVLAASSFPLLIGFYAAIGGRFIGKEAEILHAGAIDQDVDATGVRDGIGDQLPGHGGLGEIAGQDEHAGAGGAQFAGQRLAACAVAVDENQRGALAGELPGDGAADAAAGAGDQNLAGGNLHACSPT